MKKYGYPSIVIICLFVPVLRWIAAILFAGVMLSNAATDIKRWHKKSSSSNTTV